MDKPADPATPLREVYQQGMALLAKQGRKESTRVKYLYDYQRFERWLRQTGRPVTLLRQVPQPLLRPSRRRPQAHQA